MAKHKIKVLFFIAGTLATDEETAAMEEFSVRHIVCVRNASMIGDSDPVEAFDIVAGAVPSQYLKAAAEKPPVVEAERPKTPAASAPQGSPIAPQGGEKAGEGAKAPETPPAAPPAAPAEAPKPADAAKPKAPAAKPDAAKGWKPNA